jgi:hypothetical protein
MNSSRVSEVGDLVGRIALVGIFAAMAIVQTLAIIAIVRDSGEPHFLDLATRLAIIAYVALVVGLTSRSEARRASSRVSPRSPARFSPLPSPRSRWRTSGPGCA